jgi:hypothetical protein
MPKKAEQVKSGGKYERINGIISVLTADFALA